MSASKKSISVLKTIFRSLRAGSSRNAACKGVGIEYKTLWVWMEHDPRLREKIEKLSDDKTRVAVVEDVCYHRLLTETASPVEYIFYLKNRSPDRWNNSGKVAPETLQIVLNRILFIISDTVKDLDLKRTIADRLAELGKDESMVDMQSNSRLILKVRGNVGGVCDDFTSEPVGSEYKGEPVTCRLPPEVDRSVSKNAVTVNFVEARTVDGAGFKDVEQVLDMKTKAGMENALKVEEGVWV